MNKAVILLVTTMLIMGCYDSKEQEKVSNTALHSTPVNTTNHPALKEKKYDIPVIQSPNCTVPNNTPFKVELKKTLLSLEMAIRKQDTNLLFSTMDPDVIFSHGGGLYGYKDFEDVFSYHNVWDILARLIKLKGAFVNDSVFRIPYFNVDSNCSFYEYGEYLDPYTSYFTTADTTYLYESPDSSSSKKAMLIHTFLTNPYGIEETNGFYKLTTIDNQLEGYVPKSDIYRTGDYDIIIELNSTGKWKITAFAPYD